MAAIISEPIVSEAQWLDLRKGNVGASEIGALFGVHDYLTGYGLAARKLGKLDPTADNTILKRGRMLEPVAKALLAEDRPDWKQIDPKAYFYDPVLRFGCTPDLFVKDPAGRLGVVQIKTVAPDIFTRKWHAEDGAMVPPLWIALQAMAEQHLTGASFSYVAALVIGYGLALELVELPTLPSVIEQMESKVRDFWRLVDAGQLPPPDYGVDGELLAQVLRDDDGSEIDLTGANDLPEIAAELEAAKIRLKMDETTIERCKARILDKIGHAKKARFAGGWISAPTVIRKEYLVKAGAYRRLTVKIDRDAGAP
jgi:predicted phage-related endonuclease